MPQEGCDLPIIEINVEAVDSWTRASIKDFHQILNLHPHHKAYWVRLKERLVCMQKEIENIIKT